MSGLVRRSIAPEIRQIVLEASHALARLDASRLEELALSCAALQRELRAADALEQAELVRQAKQAAADMGTFGRILEATYANLDVMRRLRELREGRIEYAVPAVTPEKHHGID